MYSLYIPVVDSFYVYCIQEAEAAQASTEDDSYEQEIEEATSQEIETDDQVFH